MTAAPMPSGRGRCSFSAGGGSPWGFTLIELMVVVGIIAVLISIILPTVGRARESANAVKCLSNMRTIVQACLIYTSENRGFVIPAQYGSPGYNVANGDAWLHWPNILVHAGYVPAPNSTGLGPQTNSIFFCPSARNENTDFQTVHSPTIPPSRVDDRNSMGLRCQDNTRTAWPNGPSIDSWYGINAVFDTADLTKGPPCRRLNTIASPPVVGLAKLSIITRPAEMVYFFDGIYANHTALNANRISARHGGRRMTNLAFFDGHTASYETASLPGGLTAKVSDFDINNLRNNYPSPPNPMWLLDQQ